MHLEEERDTAGEKTGVDCVDVADWYRRCTVHWRLDASPVAKSCYHHTGPPGFGAVEDLCTVRGDNVPVAVAEVPYTVSQCWSLEPGACAVEVGCTDYENLVAAEAGPAAGEQCFELVISYVVVLAAVLASCIELQELVAQHADEE